MEREAQAGPDTILLSHHQPITREASGLRSKGNLLDATNKVRQESGLTAWLWGHEHRLFTYGPTHDIGYAACVGHGAHRGTGMDS